MGASLSAWPARLGPRPGPGRVRTRWSCRSPRVEIPGLAYRGGAKRDARVSVVQLTDEGVELVRQAEGDLRTRRTKLVADWSADKREAVGEVLAELVGMIRAGMAARDEASDG